MNQFNYKKDFPVLHQKIHNKPFVYLDSGVTSQKPLCVIDALSDYYSKDNASVHRGVYELSLRSTNLFEKTRKNVQKFINAKKSCEIIFTSGTTESINLVAYSYGRYNFKPLDEVIISAMEHHSNIVPWQILENEIGIKLKIIPISDDGEINLNEYKKLFSAKTKIVSIIHASNVLGTINPIKEMIALAHENKVPVLVDGAQAFPHMTVDVQDLDCDFYTLSAHKAYGPTGLGVLFGKSEYLDKMPPYKTGGAMIETVSFEKTTYTDLPYKFEAGTPNIADAIAFNESLTYMQKIGMNNIESHEKDLLDYATNELNKIKGIRIIGDSKNKVGVISFVIDKIHPHDIGTILDSEGVAVRAGHHCAMPLMKRYDIPACVRVSFGLYNLKEDVDALISGLKTVEKVFA
ncbi:cysteine desulfurase [Gammaproteobacteria bacterium]|nr:cysteine desulfurase [Gammaproteobacteria bacterium]